MTLVLYFEGYGQLVFLDCFPGLGVLRIEGKLKLEHSSPMLLGGGMLDGTVDQYEHIARSLMLFT